MHARTQNNSQPDSINRFFTWLCCCKAKPQEIDPIILTITNIGSGEYKALSTPKPRRATESDIPALSSNPIARNYTRRASAHDALAAHKDKKPTISDSTKIRYGLTKDCFKNLPLYALIKRNNNGPYNIDTGPLSIEEAYEALGVEFRSKDKAAINEAYIELIRLVHPAENAPQHLYLTKAYLALEYYIDSINIAATPIYKEIRDTVKGYKLSHLHAAP
jgi:hypothetical protein